MYENIKRYLIDDVKPYLPLFAVVLIVVLFISGSIIRSQSDEPKVYSEFSPKEGVTCVKTSNGVGCWKE